MVLCLIAATDAGKVHASSKLPDCATTMATDQAAAWAATSTVGRDRPPQPFAREPALDLRGDAAGERTRDLTPFD